MNNNTKELVASTAAVLGPLLLKKLSDHMSKKPAPQAKPPRRRGNSTAPSGRRTLIENAPVALSEKQPRVGFRTAVPTDPGASARYVGCDYMGTYTSSAVASTYSDMIFEISAAESNTFPRLSAIADAFELYKFKRLRFIAIGKQASTIPGAMSLAPDLYPDGDVFTVNEARNEEGAVLGKYWETIVCEFPCKRGTRVWFLTDNLGTASPEDAILGDLHFGVEGTVTPSQPIADIFVEYDVEFAQAQSATGVSLINTIIRRSPEDRAMLIASLLRALPENERERWDTDGRRVRPKKKAAPWLPPNFRVIGQNPIPVASPTTMQYRSQETAPPGL
jgi:hypothetical protein